MIFFLAAEAPSSPLPHRNVLLLDAFSYGITTVTPIGIAMGPRVCMIYTPGLAHTSVISGILDTLSTSILLYTGFVELLAQEFLFSLITEITRDEHMEASICAHLRGPWLRGCPILSHI